MSSRFLRLLFLFDFCQSTQIPVPKYSTDLALARENKSTLVDNFLNFVQMKKTILQK